MVEEKVVEKNVAFSKSENAIHSALYQKLESKTATIAILGLGYVGMPLALRFNELGYKVLGVDIDVSKIEMTNQGQTYIEHIASHKIQKAIQTGFRATANFAETTQADALILCVPTPLNTYREPDLSYVEATIDAALPYLRKGQVISLESTTYPGTTDEIIKTKIENAGFVVGKDIYVVYSPEREDPGNPDFITRTIPKVCSGCTADCLTMGVSLYRHIIDEVVPVSSTKVAEMTKLLENIHRSVNIGLANEMKIVAERMGIDIFEVIRAASTKPFGFVPYWPGPGIGGHCIPIDPFYLTWKAREYGVHTRFIELAGEINSAMPKYVVTRLAEALNQRERSVKNSKILILGVAYKPNVDDMRESPSLEVMELLEKKGALLDYADPHVSHIPKMRMHDFSHLKSVELTAASLQSYDCVMLLTAHDKFDYDLILKNARLIIDTRGVYSGTHPNLVKA